jgi:RNA recognition motif-containing protein
VPQWNGQIISSFVDDYRIFCGDLGHEVTDEMLFRAFAPFGSIVKAKVVRDRKTLKSKGYGFVSFRDLPDFIRAMKEMNGKYVGNRPIKLRKSTWDSRNVEQPTREVIQKASGKRK